MSLAEEQALHRAWLQEIGLPARLATALFATGPVSGSDCRRVYVERLRSLGASPRLLDRAEEEGRFLSVVERVRKARKLGYRAIDPADVAGLVDLPEPPLILWFKGETAVAPGPAVAIVGARRATGYGLRVARQLARDLAQAGVIVVSGLARGIDGAAHEGALEAAGSTVAILGAGPDVPYPPEHAELQGRIETHGGVLTEHLPGTPPMAHNFPRRNRLLVARASALVLVEARIKSGSMTSVRWAADLGREVLVVPGPIDSALSEGPLQLLREGATPIGGAHDVLAVVGLEAGAGGPSSGAAPNTGRAEIPAALGRILALLEAGPLSIDDLIRLSGEPPSRVFSLVLSAEVSGHLRRTLEGLVEISRA